MPGQVGERKAAGQHQQSILPPAEAVRELLQVRIQQRAVAGLARPLLRHLQTVQHQADRRSAQEVERRVDSENLPGGVPT